MLYLAAKYQLPELVKACEVALLNSLSEGNALATLVIIDRHCPESASRNDIIKFIATNITDISKTEEWGKLGKDHFNLVTEIVTSMADNKDQAAEEMTHSNQYLVLPGIESLFGNRNEDRDSWF